MASQPTHIQDGQLTTVMFEKIKNHLLSDYSATEPGRFTYYLATDQEYFWRLISEKYPMPKGLRIGALEKAAVVWERLAQEPSPKRFIELCQAIADHIFFIQNLPATERMAPMYFTDSMHSAFIQEVCNAFSVHDCENLLTVESSQYDPSLNRCISYTGSDFGVEESEQFIMSVFQSEIVSSAISLQQQDSFKKRWGISKVSSKLKFPGFEIGAEAEKK